MKITREYKGRSLVAYCDPDLEVQANSLLKLVEDADAKVGGLKDGTVIEFGWAPLRLHAEDADLVICEPDYTGSADRFVPTVSRTLRVVAEQAAMLNALGVDGVAAKYDEGVVLKRDVLELRRVYMHRRQPVSDHDSGWYIGPPDDVSGPPDASQLDAIQVYRLLDIRPALLRVMALPAEYIVVFDGDEIEAVLNPRGRYVWPGPPDDAATTKA
jgi:hypothetical protein